MRERDECYIDKQRVVGMYEEFVNPFWVVQSMERNNQYQEKYIELKKSISSNPGTKMRLLKIQKIADKIFMNTVDKTISEMMGYMAKGLEEGSYNSEMYADIKKFYDILKEEDQLSFGKLHFIVQTIVNTIIPLPEFRKVMVISMIKEVERSGCAVEDKEMLRALVGVKVGTSLAPLVSTYAKLSTRRSEVDRLTMSKAVFDTIKKQNMVQGVLMYQFLEAFTKPCILVVDNVGTALIDTYWDGGIYYFSMIINGLDIPEEEMIITLPFAEGETIHKTPVVDFFQTAVNSGSVFSKAGTHNIEAVKDVLSAVINSTLMLTCDTLEYTVEGFYKIDRNRKRKRNKNTPIVKYKFIDMGALKFKQGPDVVRYDEEEDEGFYDDRQKRKSPRPHMRSGYFRMQWYGSRTQEGKREQKVVWIGPSSVMGGSTSETLVFKVLK